MEPMTFKGDVLEVFDLIYNKLTSNKEVANVNWGNPGGNTGITKTYELENENRKIQIS